MAEETITIKLPAVIRWRDSILGECELPLNKLPADKRDGFAEGLVAHGAKQKVGDASAGMKGKPRAEKAKARNAKLAGLCRGELAEVGARTTDPFVAEIKRLLGSAKAYKLSGGKLDRDKVRELQHPEEARKLVRASFPKPKADSILKRAETIAELADLDAIE